MISKDKQYRTRDGREVRIYATDGHETYPIHGAIMDQGWCPHHWTHDGRGAFTRFDLIEVKPRIKRTVWLNVFPEHDRPLPTAMGYESKSDADGMTDKTRLACVKVEIDCEEGEGL
jgi:hypothetical protein